MDIGTEATVINKAARCSAARASDTLPSKSNARVHSLHHDRKKEPRFHNLHHVRTKGLSVSSGCGTRSLPEIDTMRLFVKRIYNLRPALAPQA
eukprot:2526415-Rhodomonas_salina.1